MDKLQNIHPGTILSEEFLHPMSMSHANLAKSINVSSQLINEIVSGKHNLTADIATGLATVFGTSVKFWTGLQNEYELREARRAVGAQLERIISADSAAFGCPANAYSESGPFRPTMGAMQRWPARNTVVNSKAIPKVNPEVNHG